MPVLTRLTLCLAALLLWSGQAVEARTLRWARQGDVLTLDPHGQNNSPTHNFNGHIYEGLFFRGQDGKLSPLLSVSWKMTADPSVWEFKLRPNVKFHDGSPLTADDVVYSLERSRLPTSDIKGNLASVETITKVDDLTVQIKTKGANPILPELLVTQFIMSKAWCEKNNAGKPQDYKNKEENYAVLHANGTGPFELVSREIDVKTVLKRNDNYWGKTEWPTPITEIIFTPIKSDATRIAALLSGEIDFVHDVPVQDIERLKNTPNIRVTTGAENRGIFLGFNVGAPELKSSDVRGKNPFADKVVRKAMNLAVNRDAIQRVVMRGQSVSAGMVISQFVNGWSKELDAYPKADPAEAKKMLVDAGYPNGFSVTLHCPNDRYINDEAVCQAVVGQLAQIGVRVSLVAQSQSLHFPLLLKRETDFYMLGWGPVSYDSENPFAWLYHTQTDKLGGYNATRYSNAEVDRLTESLSSEPDIAKRNATIRTLWEMLKEEAVYIPLHSQMLAHGMKSDIDMPVHPDNAPFFKFLK
jgi:peptide/nickel transport system substrate-binding protein